MTSNEEAILSIDTLMHYGLKQQPFAAEAPDAYIYSDPALDMPVNAALNFLQTEDHIVLLKGEYGIGKTTHIKKLINKSRGSMTPCLFSANISSSLAEIEHCMRQCWPLDEQKQDLSQFLAEAMQKGIRPALIIDDAHDLDVDVLEQLLLIRRNVKELCGKGFGLLLVGESNIEHTLSSLEADIPEISHSHSLVLRPLTREQVNAYIDHRMRIAGMFMASPFDAEVIENIVQGTHGLPGDINPSATRVLESHGQAILHKEKANRPGWIHHNRVALSIIAVASIALIGIAVLIHDMFFSEPPARTSTTRVISAPLPKDTLDAEAEATTQVGKATPPPTEVETRTTESTVADPIAKLVTPPALETTEKPAVDKRPEPAPEPTQTAPSKETTPEPVAEAPSDTSTTTKPANTEPAPPPAPASTSVTKPQKGAAPSISTSLNDPEWILNQDSSIFAVQLVAVSTLEALEKAAKELDIPADLAYYTRKKDKKILYILIAAPYADRPAAEKAITTYPGSLRRSKPWIRPIKDIQDTIYAQ